MFLFLKKKELAETFIPYTPLEASITAGTGAAIFITILPLLGSYTGVICAQYWSSSIGCTMSSSAISGLLSGTSSGLCTSSLTYYITKRRYKQWCIDNAGKYVRSNISGRLTSVPAAFIMPVAITSLPTWVSVVTLTGLSFTYSYVKTRRKLGVNNN
jgi:hypothetical protein